MSASNLDSDLAVAADLLEIDSTIEVSVVSGGASARFVTFFYGDNLYGLRAEEIAEVTHVLPISPLPNSPKLLCGIAPLRGEIVAVVDLRSLLQEATFTQHARPKFVILRAAANETPIAFKVDCMHELVAADEASYSPSTGTVSVLTGAASVDGRSVGIIRGERIRAALGS